MAFAFASAFVSLALWVYVHICGNPPESRIHVYTAVAIGAAICIWTLHRLLLGQYSWRTTTEGLYSSSLLRRKYERWRDVTSAPQVVDGRHRTSDRQCSARRYGSMRAPRYRPTQACRKPPLTLWMRCLTALPQEIEWTNPRAGATGLSAAESHLIHPLPERLA